MLPSIHSMWPSASTRARLVTRLKTLFDQFWIVVYVTARRGLTTISTTAECSESVRVDGRRAALDVVHLAALVGDDQRALELAHVLRVDAEVGLQRHLDLHARRHVDERCRPTTPPS